VRAERMMVRSMCGVSLRDGKSSAELLSRLGLVGVSEVVEKIGFVGLGMWREKMWRIGF